MNVKIKKLFPFVKTPVYAKQGDAGMDLTAISKVYDKNGNVSYGTGLCVEIPEGYVGLIFPRSSISKQDLVLSNSVGVIDSGYRGEILVKFKPTLSICNTITEEETEEMEWDNENMTLSVANNFLHYEVGDRVAQMIIIPYPQIQFEVVEELSSTERSEGGFGSSGR